MLFQLQHGCVRLQCSTTAAVRVWVQCGLWTHVMSGDEGVPPPTAGAGAGAGAGGGSSGEDPPRLNKERVFSVHAMLAANSWDARGTCLKTVATLVSNLLKHPGDAKYAIVRLKNKAVAQRIAQCEGGVASLKLAGTLAHVACCTHGLAAAQKCCCTYF